MILSSWPFRPACSKQWRLATSHRRQALFEAKANIGRTRYGLAKNLAREVRETSAAARTATIDSQKQQPISGTRTHDHPLTHQNRKWPRCVVE